MVPFLPYNKVRYWEPYKLSGALGDWLWIRHNRIEIVNIFRYDVYSPKREMYPSNIVEDGIRIIYKIVLWGGDESASQEFQYNVLNNQKLFGMDLFQTKNLNRNDGMDLNRNDGMHMNNVLRDIMLDLYKQHIEPNVIVSYFDSSVTWSEIFVSLTN